MSESFTFTKSEVSSIAADFTQFKDHNAKESMVSFYQKLFKQYPRYFKMFPRLSEVSLLDVSESNWLRHVHGTKTISLIGEFVQKLELDSAAAMRPSIRKLLFTPHHTRNAVKPDDYRNALKVFLATMDKVLGSSFKKNGHAAWQKFIDYLLVLIEEEYERAAKHQLEYEFPTSNAG